MAMLQLTAAVAVLARHFRFHLVPGCPIEPTAWTNIRPKDGMWMTVEPRLAMPSRAA
jgi:cytochrome P450